MQVAVKIQNNGQAIIPAEVIRHLGGQPGAELVIAVDSDHAMLRLDNAVAQLHSLYTQDIPPNKSVQDFLDDYERKYKMASKDFWRKYKAGELECDVEFIDWAGHYEHKLYLDSIDGDAKSATFEHFKHHRIPAPGLSFDKPNLEFLIHEIEDTLLKPA